MNPYSCLNGHVIYCDEDLSGMVCPLCLGKVKDEKNFALPIILSPAQVSSYGFH